MILLFFFLIFVNAELQIFVDDGEPLSLKIWQWSDMSFNKSMFAPLILNYNGTDTGVKGGYLILIPSSDKITAKSQVRDKCQSGQFDGIIVPAFPDNGISYSWVAWNGDIISTPIPVGLITPSSYKAVRSKFFNLTSVNSSVTGWNDNLWLNFALSGGYASVSAIMACTTVLLMSWASYKLSLFHKNDQLKANIACICLSLEILGNAARTVYLIMDIFNALTRVNDPDTYFIVREVIFYSAFPFTFCSGIFMIFFWFDITSKSMYQGSFLDKALKPAIVLVVICFLVCIIEGVLYGVGVILRETTLSGTVAVILVFCLIVAIIYFVTAKRVYEQIISYGKAKRKDLLTITIKIIISGIFIVFIAIIAFVIVTSNYTFTIINTCRFLLEVCFSCRSFIQIDVFGTQKKKGSSESATTNDSTPPSTESKEQLSSITTN